MTIGWVIVSKWNKIGNKTPQTLIFWDGLFLVWRSWTWVVLLYSAGWSDGGDSPSGSERYLQHLQVFYTLNFSGYMYSYHKLGRRPDPFYFQGRHFVPNHYNSEQLAKESHSWMRRNAKVNIPNHRWKTCEVHQNIWYKKVKEMGHSVTSHYQKLTVV